MTSPVYSSATVWQEIKPAFFSQKKALVSGLLALLLLGLSQALFLLLIKGFVKALFTQSDAQIIRLGELLPPEMLRWTSYSVEYPVPQASLAVAVPLLIIAAGLLMSLALYHYQYNQQAVSMYVAKYLRERVFSKILAFDYSRIVTRSAGDWMSIIMNDILFLQNRFSDLLTALFKDTVVIFSCFAVLLYIHLPTALVLLALSPVIAFGMGRTGKRIARFAEKFQRELAHIAAIVLNVRERFDFIRAQRGEARELDWFRQSNLAYYRMIRRSILIRSAFAPAMELIGFMVFAGLVWGIGSGRWQGLSPDLLMQFFVAVGLLLRPLREVGEQVARLQETLGAMTMSLDLLRAKGGEVIEPGVKSQPQVIELSRIALGYDETVRFSSGDLTLASGKSIAVIGASGSGKSTLIKTLAGLLRPIEWQASSGWLDVACSTSFVSQEPFLFDDTIRENLLYGLTVPLPNDDELFDVLKKVRLIDLIKSAKDGLDTHFRALGSNLSGGQIQRLVIARALLRGKEYLLLDEATSAVDSEVEEEISKLLIEMCRQRQFGVLAVTHRLEWLHLYDEIWFVEAGTVAVKGTYEQVSKTNEFRMFSSSSSSFSSSGGVTS